VQSPQPAAEPVEVVKQEKAPEPARATPAAAPLPSPSTPATQPTLPEVPAPKTRAEQLAGIREQFRGLAAGDPKTALGMARQITDETEREVALMSLLTEWKQGELPGPRARALAIAQFGLESGLGLALADRPELAVAWATTMTEGEGRAMILQQVAMSL